MKYLTCIFLICSISSISATAVNLQGLLSAPSDLCACRASLEDILKQAKEQLNSLKNIDNGLVKIDSRVTNEVDKIVSNQTASFKSLETELAAIIKVETSTIDVLNQQTEDLKNVFNDFCEVCENTEQLEEIAEQQTCIIESIQKVSVNSLEDCNGVNCQAQVGSIVIP